jgi:hypothetical protein
MHSVIVVSLDQNFLSAFAKQRPLDLVRLHGVLEKCVRGRKAVCPLHGGEMVTEALQASHLSNGIFAVAESLSGGLGFQNFALSCGFNTLRLVRPQVDFPPLFPDAVKYWMPEDPKNEAGENRIEKQLFSKKIAALPYPPADYKPGMTIEQIRDALVTYRAASMCRLLEALTQKGNLDTGGDEWEVAGAIARVLIEAEVTSAETETLRDAVMNRKWEAIPALFIHSRLCAHLEWDCLKANRKISANDHFDLWRLCVALLDADVIFCDSAMKALITRAKLDDFLNLPRVFSMPQTAEAAAYLESILAS